MATGSLGISTLPTHDVSVRAKVRHLEAANEAMRAVYDDTFPIHKILLNQSGAQLRVVVASLGRLVGEEINNYRALFANGSLPDQKRTVSEDTLQTIERVFRLLTVDAPNDNISRTGQLTIFFAGLVIEHSFFATLLPDPEQAVRRFTSDDSLIVSQSSAADEMKNVEFLRRRALTAFATKYLAREFSRLLDGANEVLESSETFVENCVNHYMAQLPAYLPSELASSASTQGRRTQATNTQEQTTR
jgi:hypothetical protein